jgi:hypothetical protein
MKPFSISWPNFDENIKFGIYMLGILDGMIN